MALLALPRITATLTQAASHNLTPLLHCSL